MFFADPKLAQTWMLPATRQQPPAQMPLHRYLHFSPQRTGTQMKVSLDDEAYIGADPGRDDNPDVSFAETPKSIWLQWDKQKGAFTVNDGKGSKR